MKPELMMPVRITLPDKGPKIVKKETPPDLRTISICPIRAVTDRTLTGMELRVLLMLCAYTNKAGLTWVSLRRISEHFGVSDVRISQLTKGLEAKGYIRTVHKGFKGERADTRQIIFSDISANQAAANTGEKAPYMIEKERKQQARISKRQAKRTAKEQGLVNLDENDSFSLVDEKSASESEQHSALSQLDPDILALARQHAGQDADPAAILAAAEDLLR